MTQQNAPTCPNCGGTKRHCTHHFHWKTIRHREPAAPPEGETMPTCKKCGQPMTEEKYIGKNGPFPSGTYRCWPCANKEADEYDPNVGPQIRAVASPAMSPEPPEPTNVNHTLGKYLNTMVADLGIEGKGQYLRDLFSRYEREVATAPAGMTAAEFLRKWSPAYQHGAQLGKGEYWPDRWPCEFAEAYAAALTAHLRGEVEWLRAALQEIRQTAKACGGGTEIGGPYFHIADQARAALESATPQEEPHANK